MKIESVPIGSLTADPANVRRHPDRNLEAIKGSLLRFGQQKPIVVTAAGVVVAGNGTLEAARALGWTELQVVRTTLKATDLAAFAIADNRTAELAEWDDAELAKLLAAIRDDGGLEGVGFDDADLADIELRIASAGGKSYDESCADDVATKTCPKCGHEFPV